MAAIPAVQSATARTIYNNPSTSVTLTLPNPPVVGNLVVAAIGFNKGGGSAPSASSGWLLAGSYLGVSVGQIVAYRVSNGAPEDRTCIISWTGNVLGTQAVIAELPVTGATLAQAAVFPNPVNDTSTASVVGNAGDAAANGAAIAFVSVDSRGTPDPAPTWTGDYAEICSETGDLSGGPQDNGGASIAIAGKTLAAGDSTEVTAAWSGASDQYALTVLRFASTPAQVGRVIERWNGTAWVPQKVDRWNGTTFVPQIAS